MPIASSVEDEIRAAATMASLALALLVFFTNIRRDSLKEYLKAVDALSFDTIRGALPDLALALLTAGAVVSMAPLCFASFDLDAIGRRSGVLPSMFGLIWLGFVLVLLFQLWMLGCRFSPAIKARWPRRH
jgi:hypothetical protein